MKIIVNEKLVTSRVRLGKIAAGGGFALLILGFVVSVIPALQSYFWLSLACLLLGILASSVGAINLNRWFRKPRADEVIDRGLKGFDDRYRVYHYTLPAPHVLLAPTGVYVLTANIQDGAIRYENGKWQRGFNAMRLLRFMADEGLGRPFEDADAEVQALRRWLDNHDVADGLDIESALVFVHPQAQLDVHDPPRPVLTAKELKRVIRREDKKLPADRYRQLMELFEGEGL